MGEKRLIDAKSIVSVAEHAYGQWNLAMAAADGKREISLVFKMQELCKAVKAVAENAPTVDAVEVVRCRDCKHWLKDVAGCTDFVGRCEWANYMVGSVGYCVYGERKDGDGYGNYLVHPGADIRGDPDGGGIVHHCQR